MNNNVIINCQNCGHIVNVETAIRERVYTELTQEHAHKLEELNKLQQEFEEKKEKARQEYQQRLEEDRKKLREEERQKLALEQEAELKAKNAQIKALSIQAIETQRIKLESEQLREQLKQRDILEQERLKVEIGRETTKLLEQARVKQEQALEILAKQKDTDYELKLREMQKKLDDQQFLVSEMQRKQQQGSMQMQGEVQELLMEEWLRKEFPRDNIEEIKKGERGGDILHHIIHTMGWECGTIYYESKRAQNFNKEWIEKLKQNMHDCKKMPDLGVLVVSQLPKDKQFAYECDGIWICSLVEFKALCKVFRASVLRWAEQSRAQQNKDGKLGALYDFLTGPDFKRCVYSVAGAFKGLEEQLNKERKSLEKSWKLREKHIQQAQTGLIDMYTSLQVISGGSDMELLSDFEQKIGILEQGENSINSLENSEIETQSSTSDADLS